MDLKEVLEHFYLEIRSLNKEITYLKRELFETRQKLGFLQTNNSSIPTNNWSFKPLNAQKLGISIGNEGVPTDRQTNQQTDKTRVNSQKDTFFVAQRLIDNLGSLREEIAHLFKNLTKQEIVVLATIYQLDNDGECDYRLISSKLNLSESSIRDYVGKLIKKGVPLQKNKLKNKQISLYLSEYFKKTITLSQINSLINF